MKHILLILTLVLLAGCRDDGNSSSASSGVANPPAPSPGPTPGPSPIPFPQVPLVATAKSRQALPGKPVEIDVAGGKPPYRIEADIGSVTEPVSNPIGIQAFYQAPQERGKTVTINVSDSNGGTERIYLRIPKKGDIDEDFGEPKFDDPYFFGETSFSQAATIHPLKSGGYLVTAFVSVGLFDDIIGFVRLDNQGKFDKHYGDSGVVRLRYKDVSTSLLKTFLLPNGQIMIFAVVGKIDSRKIVAARMNADGKIDESFGSNGWQDVSSEGDRRWDRVWFDEASSTYRLVTSTQGFDGPYKSLPRIMVARTMSLSGQVASGTPYNLVDEPDSSYYSMAIDPQEFAVYLMKKVCKNQNHLGLCKEQVIVEKHSDLMNKVVIKEILHSDAADELKKTKNPSLFNIDDELWADLPSGYFDTDTPNSIDIYRLDMNGSLAPTKVASFPTWSGTLSQNGHQALHSIKKLATGSLILNFAEGNHFGFGGVIVQGSLAADNTLNQDADFAEKGILTTSKIELVNDALMDKDGDLILAGRNGHGFTVTRIWE